MDEGPDFWNRAYTPPEYEPTSKGERLWIITLIATTVMAMAVWISIWTLAVVWISQ